MSAAIPTSATSTSESPVIAIDRPVAPDDEPNLDQQQAELARLVTRLTPNEGVHASAIPGLTLIRANSPSVPTPSLYDPSLCIVVQGRKRAMLGEETYYYDALNYLNVSVTLPAIVGLAITVWAIFQARPASAVQAERMT